MPIVLPPTAHPREPDASVGHASTWMLALVAVACAAGFALTFAVALQPTSMRRPATGTKR